MRRVLRNRSKSSLTGLRCKKKIYIECEIDSHCEEHVKKTSRGRYHKGCSVNGMASSKRHKSLKLPVKVS